MWTTATARHLRSTAAPSNRRSVSLQVDSNVAAVTETVWFIFAPDVKGPDRLKISPIYRREAVVMASACCYALTVSSEREASWAVHAQSHRSFS